jgi:hypothetical protein
MNRQTQGNPLTAKQILSFHMDKNTLERKEPKNYIMMKLAVTMEKSFDGRFQSVVVGKPCLSVSVRPRLDHEVRARRGPP